MYTESGVIVQLQLLKNRATGATRIDRAEFVPTYVSTQNGYKVLPVMDAIRASEAGWKDKPCYSPADLIRLRSVWKETAEHLSNAPKYIVPVSSSFD